MPLFRIFHSDNFPMVTTQLLQLGIELPAEAGQINIAQYSFVGSVRAKSLEEAYFLTQNLFDSWCKGSEVTMAAGKEQGARSTSCGDLIVDPDNAAWLVCVIGFDRIGKILPGRETFEIDLRIISETPIGIHR